MLVRYSVVLLVLGVLGCKGSGDESPQLKDYSCFACGEYDPIIAERDEAALVARCEERTSVLNGGTTCQIGNVTYSELLTTFKGCEEAPPCAADSGGGQAGAAGFGWDYECQFCDDEAAVDRAYDGGVEGSGCRESGILLDVGMKCPDGGRAVVVGLSECDEVPACAK